MRLLCCILFFTSLSIAQDKTSHSDLRTETEIIRLVSKKIHLKILKTKDDNYTYSINEKNKHKISNENFEKIDKMFVKDFIHLKYMMGPRPKKCKKHFEVFMRGESLLVCHSETQKIKILQTFAKKVKDLK